jgi:hypothetical protein
MARERPGQTLDAAALVHEAYLRLVGPAIEAAPGWRYAYEHAARLDPENDAANDRLHLVRAQQKRESRALSDLNRTLASTTA